MLNIPGRPHRTCEGLTRRDWLTAGSAGVLGLTLADLTGRQALASADSPAFGRAKSCIVLFMFGAPAHQDTWDLKPEAPSAVRGEFQPISTRVPGISICEHLPQLAARTDRLTQIRSLTHVDNTHTVAMHYMLTGVRHPRPATNPQNAADDFPCYGAVVRHLQSPADRGGPLPAGISLNAPANQVSANNHIFPGFFGGFLGHGVDPLFISQHANSPAFRPLPSVESPGRLLSRQALLNTFDRTARHLRDSADVASLDLCYRQAIDLLTSPQARRAFELQHEPDSLRQRYGHTPFGQGCLLARRLVEAGTRLVTVNWERDDAYWDTHADNFTKHRDPLLPNMDQGFSALLDDLEQRGLLDETLVVWLGEFGRTPKINSKAGRDHWAACNTVVLAGAGLPGGMVHGASDAQAAFPASNPVQPEDLAATIYTLLGVPTETLLSTPAGRPVPLTTGQPLQPLLGG